MGTLSDLIAAKAGTSSAASTSEYVYTAGLGVLGHKDAIMPKAGDMFLPENDADIAILEEFVVLGIVEKNLKASIPGGE